MEHRLEAELDRVDESQPPSWTTQDTIDLLLSLEYCHPSIITSNFIDYSCPVCHADEGEPHGLGCRLNAALEHFNIVLRDELVDAAREQQEAAPWPLEF